MKRNLKFVLLKHYYSDFGLTKKNEIVWQLRILQEKIYTRASSRWQNSTENDFGEICCKCGYYHKVSVEKMKLSVKHES
jgi:hypothetical protein